MNGLARKLFHERSQKAFSHEPKKCQWPLLEKMIVAKRLGYIDLALAQRFLDGEFAEEAAASLFCHLFMAARKGHVCIKIKDGLIIPSLEEIWSSDEVTQESFSETFEKLKELILQGSEMPLPSLISQGNDSQQPFEGPIVKNDHAFYLQRYWFLESLFLLEMKRKIMGRHPLKLINVNTVEDKLKELILEGTLLKEQAEAVLNASQSLLTLITGGPGTGKTYTAGILLRTIWEALSEHEKEGFTIALAAPTGKAAAKLEESMQKALKGVVGFPTIKSQTLHQLLGIKKNGLSREPLCLSADLVLIDESSMIDIKMMGQLFSAIKPGSRLIMLGDKHQLASIEAGSVFADLIQAFISHPKMAKVVELKTCVRVELKSMIDFAHEVKTGNAEGALKFLEGHAEGVTWVELRDEWGWQGQQKRLLNHVLAYFPIVDKLPEHPLDLLTQFNRFRILVPLRKGPLGADALNEMIFQLMHSKMEQQESFIAPIMILQNDYRMNLFNGEMGLIVRKKGKEFALFPSAESEQNFRQIPSLLLPKYEYAYCLSIHKSQGSEFNHVVLLLPEGTQSFGREALYTGVTRAKKQLEIWSQPKVLSQMIATSSARQSGIIERLSD